MKDQNIKTDIIQEIKSGRGEYKSSVPPYAWSRIESRLDKNKSNKEISFYKLFYNAAVVLLLIGALALISVVVMKEQPADPIDDYAQNIHELNISSNSYPVYDIHQLQKAYQRLEQSQGNQWLSSSRTGDL